VKGKRILVVGSSARSAAIAAALVAAGADVVQATEFPITARPEMTGAWLDEIGLLERLADKRHPYGPPQKGRGGKLKRW